LSRNDALANAAVIVRATDLPVSADLEDGFGPRPEDVAETIRQAAAIGLVGCTIEDTTADPATRSTTSAFPSSASAPPWRLPQRCHFVSILYLGATGVPGPGFRETEPRRVSAFGLNPSRRQARERATSIKQPSLTLHSLTL